MLSPRAILINFSIAIWTETGIGEYEVEVLRIKGGEGGSKRKVAAAIKRQLGEDSGVSGSSQKIMSC